MLVALIIKLTILKLGTFRKSSRTESGNEDAGLLPPVKKKACGQRVLFAEFL
jgi:hypothetical protein